MSRLISISGPPISGKTTLINRLKKELPVVVDVVPDLPRLAIECIGSELTQRDQKAFQHYIGFAQLLAEEAELSDDTIRILDKSLLDAVAYWDVLIGESRPVWASALQAQRYAFVFICDHKDIIPHGDDVQQLHKAYRDTLGDQIFQVAHEVTNQVKIISGDISTRHQTIIATMMLHGIISSI
jgi:nicotinamide riboside kinase